MTQIILTQALYYLIMFIQMEPTFFILFNTPEYNTTVKTAMGDLCGRRPPVILDRLMKARMRFQR